MIRSHSRAGGVCAAERIWWIWLPTERNRLSMRNRKLWVFYMLVKYEELFLAPPQLQLLVLRVGLGEGAAPPHQDHVQTQPAARWRPVGPQSAAQQRLLQRGRRRQLEEQQVGVIRSMSAALTLKGKHHPFSSSSPFFPPSSPYPPDSSFFLSSLPPLLQILFSFSYCFILSSTCPPLCLLTVLSFCSCPPSCLSSSPPRRCLYLGYLLPQVSEVSPFSAALRLLLGVPPRPHSSETDRPVAP